MLLEFSLVRLSQDLSGPQRGILLIEGEPVFTTLELPWLDNRPNISCIPEGSYECKKTFDRFTGSGHKIVETFEVTHVGGRGGILFHIGNTAKDTRGCILLGMAFDTSADFEPCITESAKAFAAFLRLLRDRSAFNLKIEGWPR